MRVQGFLVFVRPQTGSAEGTNCRYTKAAETDWHMALVENAGDGEHDAVVVETTPRIRKKHANWTKKALNDWIDSVGSASDHEDRGVQGGKWVNLDDIDRDSVSSFQWLRLRGYLDFPSSSSRSLWASRSFLACLLSSGGGPRVRRVVGLKWWRP